MNKPLWVVGLLAALTQGCMVSQTRVIDSDALLHSKHPYAVAYDDRKSFSVLGDDWQLETHRIHKDDTSGSLKIERKENYTTTYEYDFDDDDKSDEKEILPNPDLVLVNGRTNARIEVTTLLLDKRLAKKELRVLLNDIVDSASGTRSLFVGFGRVAGGVEKRFATRLLESSPAELQGNQGLVATIERANVDQLQLNPNARWRRSRLFLVHAPFEHYVLEDKPGDDSVGPPAKAHPYRVLLLVEYTNTPEDFEAQYPDLVRFLGKLHFLNDDELLELLAPSLRACGNEEPNRPTVQLSINAIGEASLEEESGFDRLCVADVLPLVRFTANGAKRKVSHNYDFTREQKAAWLGHSSYTEQRVAPSAAKAPSAEPAPAPSAPKPKTSDAPPTTPTAAEAPSAQPATPPPAEP
jgi:hypothetical protein